MRKRSIIQMVLVGVLTGAVVGAIAWFVPWLPEPASEQAGPVDDLYWFVTIICLVIFSIVAGVSVYAVWKFRARPDDVEDGSPIHGHTGLEIVWTAVPAALVTAIAVYSGVVLAAIEDIPDRHRVVEVTAQQFAWSFTYPDLGITTGELHLALGEPVELKIQSKDVIHSFWVPQFRMKRDAVPGVQTSLVITPAKTGTFPVVCAELCGLGHATMRSRAVVTTRQEFDRWVAEQKQAAAAGGAVQGEQLFASLGCGGCHALADAGTTAEVGPNLDKVLPGKDAEFVRESIVSPDAQIAEGFQPGVMPQDFGERLSDEQLDSLVEYLLEATKGG